jgi:hypothetical protein
MRGEERLARCLRATLRCGLNAVVLKDRLDGIAGDVVTETLEPSDDTRDGRQSAPAKNLAFHGQAAALVVAEMKPSRSVRGAEDSLLLEHVVNNGLLLPVDPAGEEENSGDLTARA